MEIAAIGEIEDKKPEQAFQLRGSLQTILCLRIVDIDRERLTRQVLEKVAHNPEFFRDAPVILDVGPLVDRDADNLPAIVDCLRDLRLCPVGIQNGSEDWNGKAAELWLGRFAPGSAQGNSQNVSRGNVHGRDDGTASDARQPPPSARHGSERLDRSTSGSRQRVERAKTFFVKLPVRGGQQVMGEGDVVATAAISPGAEVAAGGSLHVYAPLRGRAFAGIDGDEAAMIFCDYLDAELLSIAGIHLVNEEIDSELIGQRCRVFLRDQRLHIERMR